MFVHCGCRGTNHRQVIGALSDFGEQVTDFQSALAVPIECEGAAKDGAIVVELSLFDFAGHRFAMPFF